MQIVLDIETNGLLPNVNTIWCIVCKEFDTENKWIFTNQDNIHYWPRGSECRILKPGMYRLERFKLFLEEQVIEVIGHNIINFDIPVLEKLLDANFSNCKIIDTTIISRVLYPDRPPPRGKFRHSHSLEAWGVRMGGEQKVQQDQWTIWEPNMLTRCVGDVRLTEKLYLELLNEL